MIVIDPTQETMTLNVISRLVSVMVKLKTIAKIRGLHEGHHFIPMAMKVHGTPKHDMDRFIKECAHLFHNRQLKDHLFLSFCIQFFKQCVSIALQRALTFAIEKKIALIGNACYRPPITIRSHDLHEGDIKRAMNDIASYHERN